MARTSRTLFAVSLIFSVPALGGACAEVATDTGGPGGAATATGGAGTGGTAIATGGFQTGTGGFSSTGGTSTGGVSTGLGGATGGTSSGGTSSGGTSGDSDFDGQCAGMPTHAEWIMLSTSEKEAQPQAVTECDKLQAECSGLMTSTPYLFECTESHLQNCDQKPSEGSSWSFVGECTAGMGGAGGN